MLLKKAQMTPKPKAVKVAEVEDLAEKIRFSFLVSDHDAGRVYFENCNGDIFQIIGVKVSDLKALATYALKGKK